MSDFITRFNDSLGGESLAAFARRIGVPDSSIRNIANRRSVPGGDLLVKIARGLGRMPDWLLTGEGPMIPPPITGDAATEQPAQRTAGAGVMEPPIPQFVGHVPRVEVRMATAEESFAADLLANAATSELGPSVQLKLAELVLQTLAKRKSAGKK